MLSNLDETQPLNFLRISITLQSAELQGTGSSENSVSLFRRQSDRSKGDYHQFTTFH